MSSHDLNEHDPGLAPEPDKSPPGTLLIVIVATLLLMVVAIVGLIPIVSAQTDKLDFEKNRSVMSGELAELQAAEDAALTGYAKNDDGSYSIPVAVAKEMVAGKPGLLTDAFGAPAAPAAVAVVEGVDAELAAAGQALYTGKICMTCHSLDGAKGVGPSFKGLFGREETLSDGTTVVVDEAYLTESILTPNAKVVQGFPPAMPPMVTEQADVDALIAYIKTL